MGSPYYKDSYGCIIIGSALAGMSAALKLSKRGFKDILILERQNTPGGVTTSFVRSGVELEASLHEISSVSSKRYPLFVRKFLNEFDVNVSFVRSDEAFHYVEPGFSCTVHCGKAGRFEIPCHDISLAVGDESGEIYDKLMLFFQDCKNVFDSIGSFSDGDFLGLDLIQSHIDLMRSLSYSTMEVIDVYGFPDIVKRILLAYWCYLGNEPGDLPYVLYSCLMTDYLGYGVYTCKETSHELSIKLLEACRKKSIQVEFNQEVKNILVKDGHVIGVRLMDGNEISSNYVVSGPYPNTVYNYMIEPPSEAPQKAFQMLNAKSLSMSVFSIIMILDEPPEKLNMDHYMTFVAPSGLDFKKIMDSYHSDHGYEYFMAVCFNQVLDYCPKGKTIYSITALPYPDSFKDVTEENYDEKKHVIAREMIQEESRRLGVNLLDHILDIEFITPVSIAHYCKSFQGCIYGYLASLDDNVAARIMEHEEEQLIKGLAFAGAHQMSGDGMGTQFINGNQAAEDIYKQFQSDVPGPLQNIIIPKKPKKKSKSEKKKKASKIKKID